MQGHTYTPEDSPLVEDCTTSAIVEDTDSARLGGISDVTVPFALAVGCERRSRSGGVKQFQSRERHNAYDSKLRQTVEGRDLERVNSSLR